MKCKIQKKNLSFRVLGCSWADLTKISILMYMEQSKSQIAVMLGPLTASDKIALLKSLLQDYDTPQYRKERKAQIRKEKYRLDAEYREHVLELKRNRCFQRYWNDDTYREKLKDSARYRAAAENLGTALHAQLASMLLE